jgi:RNA polymerase-binding protein DksA
MDVNTKKIKATLEARQVDLKDRQERVSKHTRHRETPLPADFAEQAIELENGETLVALDQELSAEITRIDKALIRLESGNYFNCQSCGEPIGAARLDALPDTPLCIDCANEA